MPLIVNALAFAAVFLTVFAANALLLDLQSGDRKRVKERMQEQFRAKQRDRARTSPLLKDFSTIAAEASSEHGEKKSVRNSFQSLVEQSGLDITVAALVKYMIVSGIVSGVFIGALLRSPSATFLAMIVGAIVPVLYVQWKRRSRLEALRRQLPDAFDMMARVLRAGQTITQAIQAVAEEFSEPIAIEFLYCFEQMNLGLPAEAALRDLGRRTGLLEIKIFILAVVVHRQTGGNLAQLLDKLGHVVRERFRIRGMINSLTAQGRFQAGILLGLPPFMFLLLAFVQPDYGLMLLQYPLMIVTALSLMFAGAMWIRQVVNFDY
jgi:tight adherence protein B